MSRKEKTYTDDPPFDAPFTPPVVRKSTPTAAPAAPDACSVLDQLACYYRKNGDGARTTAIEFAIECVRGNETVPQ